MGGCPKKIKYLLIIVSKCLALNRLSLNIKKTTCITFAIYSNEVPETLDVILKGMNIEKISRFKYLGIQIDSNLKWDKHIEYITKKMNI